MRIYMCYNITVIISNSFHYKAEAVIHRSLPLSFEEVLR